jgi:hypothetical protein
MINRGSQNGIVELLCPVLFLHFHLSIHIQIPIQTVV